MATNWVDGYYPDSKNPKSIQDGLEFQDFIIDLLCNELGLALSNYSSRKWQFDVGENKQGIEIKLDNGILKYGNVSVEVAEKSKASNAKWVDSGILRKDNTWLYIQGNKEIVFIFAKRILLGLYNSGKYKVTEFPRANPTIKRFLMPVDDARKYCAKVFDLRN